MRGEETQIAGALALDPALAVGAHVLVLPGTHSKWVRVEGGRIVDFRTVMTGELFALLREHSLLIGAEATPGPQGFADGLAAAAQGGALTALFAARSRQLIDGASVDWATGYVSGLLIGSEVREGLIWTGAKDVIVIGASALSEHYVTALAASGVAARTIDGDDAVVAGLSL